MAGESSWMDYAGAGAGIIGGYAGVVGAQTEYAYTVASIEEQKERNQLALTDRVNARQQQLNNDVASIRAGAAARGVEGGAGVIAGKEKEAEQDVRAMKIDTAQTMRELEFQKGAAKQKSELAQTTSLLSGITSALSFAGGA